MPENPNLTFARLFPLGAPIRLDEAGEHADALAAADTNHDGKLTMKEGRDALIQNSVVLSDPKSREFRKELEGFLLDKTGRPVNLTDSAKQGVARMFYLQVNNLSNATLVEEVDLRQIAKKDPDQPTMDRVNLTAEFNTNGDVEKATSALLRTMRKYFDGYIANGQRLTAFILSGHSNGTDMLQEDVAHHGDGGEHLYFANIDIRQALRTLREENDDYAALMDGVEKVGLLACFQGASAADWRKDCFPNATIAGRSEFAPLSSSHQSAALYNAAATAHQVLEDGGSPAAATKAGTTVPLAASPTLVVQVPDEASAKKAAADKLTIAKAKYEAVLKDIKAVRQTGKPGTFDARMLYTVANNYYGALQSMWTLNGEPGGERGAQKKTIDALRFEVLDLFAIRTGNARPTALA